MTHTIMTRDCITIMTLGDESNFWSSPIRNSGRPSKRYCETWINLWSIQCLYVLCAILLSWRLSWDICPLRHTNNCTVICSWHFSFQQTKENKFYSSQYQYFSKYLSVTRANIKFLHTGSRCISDIRITSSEIFFSWNVMSNFVTCTLRKILLGWPNRCLCYIYKGDYKLRRLTNSNKNLEGQGHFSEGQY